MKKNVKNDPKFRKNSKSEKLIASRLHTNKSSFLLASIRARTFNK